MPTDHTPDPAHEDRAARDCRPCDGVDQVPQAPSTGPSIAPSTATSPTRRISAGQPRTSRLRDAFDNPLRPAQVWKPTGVRRKEVLRALGIFQRATADQLWRMLRPADRHDRITRDTLNVLKESGLVRVETRLESGHQLWVLTEKGHKEAKLLLPKTVRLSALRKLEYDDEGRPVQADGYDEHAAAVTSTAAVLTGAGYGTPLSWQTEIAHKLPYGYTQYADLTMRAPDAGVPAMLLEVDRVNEPVDELVDKLRRYHEWFELLAPKADAAKAMAARGAAVHDFRLWSRIYPATGREGYVPVAFVFTGKTAAQRASRMRRLEQAARRYFAGEPCPGRGVGITAVDYHQAVPVVVTELERITADPAGAAGAVWRRLGRDEWQTLTQALDNPDGERLYQVQLREARRRQAEREAAEREAQRPVCTQCGTKFTDERWQETKRSSWPGAWDRLCGPCKRQAADRAEAERVVRRRAEEAERAAAEAPAVKPRSRFGIGRRR
ncbi:replication-relaxation family protein [Streptomyces lavenduligriseus]|uniref:Replication-relaxation family protein n=1 Tax=Streptomyces lavenduligriseus TaxID=67315 RepID=A0ABT0P318_9ACTN|nr:replication-relaxation family protein [Streptomyces lavenduligriseus]MCL3998127.1 replication-relaxation family protein [Streptomyces lavenduligriseus]